MKEAGGCTDALSLPKAALKITFLPDGPTVSLAMHFSNFAPFMPGNILRTVLTLHKFAPSALDISSVARLGAGGRGRGAIVRLVVVSESFQDQDGIQGSSLCALAIKDLYRSGSVASFPLLTQTSQGHK